MTIFSRISKDCNNDLKIKLLLPRISRINSYNSFSDSRHRGFEFSFDTCAVFLFDVDYWYVKLSMLGFGIEIQRQTGY
jgi:hypothetical protein